MVTSNSLPKFCVKVRITTHFQMGHGPPTRQAKMRIFKLTVLESLVSLLNSPGHLRVGMTSAHQAGILELIFKEKSRGLRSSQEKSSSDDWKERGICKEQKGSMWNRVGQRK